MATETLQFQTETKRLLDLVINSIYTNKEIFLRELISNSSDAIDKLRIESLTNHDILGDDTDFEIIVDLTSSDDGIIRVSDNGIGMSKEDVINNIGTIAKSGTKEFIEKLSNDKNTIDERLIGQFGIGFYSSFIIADKVELVTKKAGTTEAVKWSSEGIGEYTIEDVNQERRGTTVTLHLKKAFTENNSEDEDFTNHHIIQKLIKKYSNYIRYPIKLKRVVKRKIEKPVDNVVDDENTIDIQPENTIEEINEIAVEIVNSMKPLWVRNKNEITKEEYNDFFKQQFHEYAEPQETYHIKGEGIVEYTALICIPGTADPNLYYVDYEAGLQLYARNVFIMDKCKDFLPDHFRFIKGLVDSPDLPLNVSREILQHSTEVKKIGKAIEKQIVKNLQRMLKNDRDKYITFWQEYGRAIKLGVYNNAYNEDAKKNLSELMMFITTKSEGKYITLAEYEENTPDNQKQLYFAVGKDINTINNLPQMEYFLDNNIEVIYLLDSADEFSLDALHEYKGKLFKSITRDGIELPTKDTTDNSDDASDDKDSNDTSTIEKLNKAHKNMLSSIKDVLANDVNDVKISDRLKSSAVCLSSGEIGPSLNVEQMYHAIGNTFMRAVRVLELNPEHKVFEKVLSVYEKSGKESEEFKNLCYLLYDQALMMDGMAPKDPLRLAKLLQSMIINK